MHAVWSIPHSQKIYIFNNFQEKYMSNAMSQMNPGDGHSVDG